MVNGAQPPRRNGGSISVLGTYGKALIVKGNIDPRGIHAFFKSRCKIAAGLALAKHLEVGRWLTRHPKLKTLDDLPQYTRKIGSTSIVFNNRFIVDAKQQTVPFEPTGIFSLPDEAKTLNVQAAPIILDGSIFMARALDLFGAVKFGLSKNAINKLTKIIKGLKELLEKQYVIFELENAAENREISQGKAEQLLSQLRDDTDVELLVLSVLAKWGKVSKEEIVTAAKKRSLTSRQWYYCIRGLCFCSKEMAKKTLLSLDLNLKDEVIIRFLKDPSRRIKDFGIETNNGRDF